MLKSTGTRRLWYTSGASILAPPGPVSAPTRIVTSASTGLRTATWNASSDACAGVVCPIRSRSFCITAAAASGASVEQDEAEQAHYVERLRSEIDFYNTRMTVRPGLTGWAQVNSGYGSSVEDARVKLSYDLYYVKNQSLSLDLIIMARTVMAVLSLSGR